MLRWDAIGETRVDFGAGAGQVLGRASACVDACTLPLVEHDFRRAAVLGTATLLMAGRRIVLLTAAHVFDTGVRFGNLLAPLASGHGLIALAGARLARARDADIAVLDISSVAGASLLLRGRRAATVPGLVPRRRVRRGHAAHAHESRVLVSGYPAALTRFEGGWLAARRLSVVTRRRDVAGLAITHADRLFDYGRVARRGDGVTIHTPELAGMSGAGIWVLDVGADVADVADCCLRLDAVQSAYVHGRYLRGHDIGAARELLDPYGEGPPAR